MILSKLDKTLILRKNKTGLMEMWLNKTTKTFFTHPVLFYSSVMETNRTTVVNYLTCRLNSAMKKTVDIDFLSNNL